MEHQPSPEFIPNIPTPKDAFVRPAPVAAVAEPMTQYSEASPVIRDDLQRRIVRALGEIHPRRKQYSRHTGWHPSLNERKQSRAKPLNEIA